AEDGIRDWSVTGVQTCALPISQIELRIIAGLSREAGLLEAFRTGVDVHTATAARVFDVFLEMVTPEMRRKAKMVNYGIAYGISRSEERRVGKEWRADG